jgi:ABC-type phosphate transport system substrate-binding protein
MVIRLGSPGNINGFPYQIGTDDLLVVVASKNPTRTLNAEQTRELFTGQIRNWKTIDGNDASVQVWVFSNGEDIQELFDETVLEGSPVSSGAYLAANMDEMVQSVGKDISAIGIITGRWKTGNLTSVYKAASNLPVLAISLSKPQGTLAGILACMQR